MESDFTRLWPQNVEARAFDSFRLKATQTPNGLFSRFLLEVESKLKSVFMLQIKTLEIKKK